MHNTAGRAEYALLTLLGGLTGLSALLLFWQALFPIPIEFPGIAIDRLNAVIALLVAGVGTVTYRFSLRYLDGEPRQRQFLGWLFFTVSAAYIFILSTNLLLLFATWSCTSLGLHQLLTFYRDRNEAYPPARKKFLISRLGDVALLCAILLIGWGWGTMDLQVFLERIAAAPGWSLASTLVALLIVVAALTKSAQFPFHSWLPETMEAPTPVSALMHAGIINAGGVLLLRFAPLIITVPTALFMLAFVGTITAILGMLAMWAQTTVKRTLAWSTVSQMGFMMVQFGLAAFPAAILHLVGHGCYKAWSFLRAGDLPRQSSSAAPARPVRTMTLALIGTLVAVPALALAALVTGFDPLHSPGELTLTTIVALSIGQVWIACFNGAAGSSRMRNITTAGLATVVVSIIVFALYRGAGLFFAPVLGEMAVPTGPLAWAAAILPAVAFVTLALLYALLPLFARTAAGRAFYVHALHGFYFGAIADRLVDRIWNSFTARSAEHA